MKGKLSNILTGFRKNHSTQHCLMCILEKWKKTLDKGGYICIIAMDFSKVFDTLNHNLLIAKVGTANFTSWKNSTSWKCSLHFVYILRTDWNVLIKFCRFDPCLKFKTCANCYYSLPCIIYKFLDMI